MDIILPEGASSEPNSEKVENAFLFALVWSLGATLKENEQARFDKLLKNLSGKTFLGQSFFDSFYDLKSKSWLSWECQANTQDFCPVLARTQNPFFSTNA